jgi:hypothetical protein
MLATTQYFVKRFIYKRSWIFITLTKFYVRHLGIKIIGPYCIPYPTQAQVVNTEICQP